MTGVSVTIEGLGVAKARLSALSRIEFHELMESLARKGQEQTRERIESEKTSPEGVPWKPTVDGRPALFVTGEHLARHIDFASTATQARWGSGWIGARVHQFGAMITPKNGTRLRFQLGDKTVFATKSVIPARPYLGVSAQNAADLERAAATFIERHW